MPDYKVQLEVFEGPLDLLLYLIRKNEVDIYRIPIAKITSQYMEYLDVMKMVAPDVVGEFVVMGATLMYIKSRMLLPQDQQVSDPDAQADELDPRWDLIRQLVEYKKFKEAAEHLQSKEADQQNVYARQQATLGFDAGPEQMILFGNVSAFDLLSAFNKVLKRANQEEEVGGEIFADRFTVSDKIDFIMKLTLVEPRTHFMKLFEGTVSKVEMVVTFLAMLELMKMRLLRIEQTENFGEIELIREDPSEEKPAEAGETPLVETVATDVTEALQVSVDLVPAESEKREAVLQENRLPEESFQSSEPIQVDAETLATPETPAH